MDAAEKPTLSLVRGPETLGALVRARRKAAGLTQAQAAGLAGVGNRFLSELERGKKTLEIGLVLQVLERLGFELAVAPRGTKLFARLLAENPSGADAGEALGADVPEGRVGEALPQATDTESVRARLSAERPEPVTRSSSVRPRARPHKKPRRGRRGG